MSAYTYFHQDHSRTSGFKDSPYIVDRSDLLTLSEPQLKFLNPGACQYVNPCSRTFWQDLKNWLSPISRQAASYPKAQSYRQELEPYLLRRVIMTAGSCRALPDKCGNSGLIHLLLTDVRLSHVYSNSVGSSPDAAVDHLNIWVSPSVFASLRRPDNTLPSLTISGVLYEYASSKSTRPTRNIAVLPILLMPRSRPPRARLNRRSSRPDSPVCPSVSM